MNRVPAYTLSGADDYRQVVGQAREASATFSEMAHLLAYFFLPPRRDCS